MVWKRPTHEVVIVQSSSCNAYVVRNIYIYIFFKFTIPTYIYNTDIAFNNITIHVIQPLLTLPQNKTKQTIMSSLLMIPTLHYTKATNHGHRTTTTTKKSALKSNKVLNLLFVRPSLFFKKVR